MSELFQRRDRALSFGTVADVYDRVRPTYPDALVRELLATNPHDVLDVGCGTGRAAVLFAAQDCTVLGVEPDAAMAEVARSHGLDVEVGTFEQWDDAGRRFDLLISGQAWHWVEPVAGGRKAAAVLRPGGVVGLFWNMDSMAPDDRAALDAVYAREAPELQSGKREYGGKKVARRKGAEDGLTAAGFEGLRTAEFAWQRGYSAGDYTDLLRTFSDHNLLPADQRTRLLTGVGEVIEKLGSLVVSYECHLITATAPAVAP